MGTWARNRALVVAVLLAACAEPPRPDRTPTRRAIPDAARTASDPLDALPTVSPGATEIAPPIDEALPYGILAIDGADAVLAVSDAADERIAFVQRIDAAGPRGAAIAMPGDHVVSAYDVAGSTLVLSTRGRALCMSELVGGVAKTRVCHDDLRADAIVRVADRFLVLAADPETPDEDDEAAKEKRRADERQRVEEAKQRKKKDQRKKAASKSRGKSKDKPRTDKATDVLARRKLEITTRALAVDGVLGDAAEKAGVVFEEPMSGMGLIGAGTRKTRDGVSDRVDLLFYEWAGAITDRRSKAVGRARFGSAALDDQGALVESTRGKFGESDLYFGFLADSPEPRLATGDRGSVLIAATSPRTACQATVISPARAPMIGDRDTCAFDFNRYIQRAAELRDGNRGKSSMAGSDPAFKTMAASLSASGAHRAEGQPGWDAERAITRAAHGFTTTDKGELLTFDRETFQVATLPRPLVAKRARAYDAAIAPDGEALIRTAGGLRLVSTEGAVRTLPDPRSPGPERLDAREIGGAPFAKISDTWWTTRGALRRLVPAEANPTPGALPGQEGPPEASVLVGGKEHGLLLQVDGESLSVSSIDGEGRLRLLSRGATPVQSGIDATARDNGGAYLVGPTRADARTWTGVLIDPDGKWAAAVLGERTGAVVPKLSRVPAHGFRLEVGGGQQAPQMLIDRRGAVRGTWAADVIAASACLDGHAWPARWPAPRTSAFVELPALASPGACVVGEPSWGEDGVLRAVVSHRVGAHTSLELARLEPPADKKGELFAPEVAAAVGGKLPDAPRRAARCTADMVLVDARLCVDRFETSVAERASGRLASPDYPITPNLFASVLAEWSTKREHVGDLYARAMPLPRPMDWQQRGVSDPIATSRSGVLPSGYLTGLIAKEVCAAVGKRLCTQDEFKTACRGEGKTRFPYGDSYRDGACNVARPSHPAAILHGHASIGHLDPRLGRVVLDETGAGLRATGATPGCASHWGGDAIYDMVGNLDEWIDEKGGAFAGGFYARGSKSGCDALVDSHPPSYLDYSTGARCCRDARSD